MLGPGSENLQGEDGWMRGDSGRKPIPESLSFPVRAHGVGSEGAGSLPRAFLAISSKGEDSAFTLHLTPVTEGAAFLPKEAHETDGHQRKWKRNLATRTAPETWSHLGTEQQVCSHMLDLRSLLLDGNGLKQPKATQKMLIMRGKALNSPLLRKVGAPEPLGLPPPTPQQ